jgi:hypothetical protein
MVRCGCRTQELPRLLARGQVHSISGAGSDGGTDERGLIAQRPAGPGTKQAAPCASERHIREEHWAQGLASIAPRPDEPGTEVEHELGAAGQPEV